MPGTPQGKGRARSTTARAGRGRVVVRHYTPAKTRNYESQIKAAAQKAMQGRELIGGPVKLYIAAIFEPPASWPKWKREAATEGDITTTGKPDLDNIVKAVKDGMNGAVWCDDSQVAYIDASKLYGETAQVIIRALPVYGLTPQAKQSDSEALQDADR